jgi:hypothetical protein
MQDIEEGIKAISRLDPDGGPDAGRAAGKRVELITFQVSEIETCIDLSREHGWGHEIAKHRKALAGVVEAHLRTVEKLTVAALPTQPARLARIRRSIPRLSAMPDPVAVGRAMTFLHFAQEVRSSANYGGFAAARGKVLEKLGDMLDSYVEEVLDLVRTGDAEDEAAAYAYLETAAQVSQLVRDDKAAELVRRRATAVRHEDRGQELRAKAS